MGNQRVPLYYELFFGLSENERIYQGLQCVASAESHCSPLVRKMALRVLDEIDFFREYKKSTFKLTMLRRRKFESDPQEVIAMDQPNSYYSDPLLEELSRAITEEIERNQWDRTIMKVTIVFAIFSVVTMIFVSIGLIVWQVGFKPPKRKY